MCHDSRPLRFGIPTDMLTGCGWFTQYLPLSSSKDLFLFVCPLFLLWHIDSPESWYIHEFALVVLVFCTRASSVCIVRVSPIAIKCRHDVCLWKLKRSKEWLMNFSLLFCSWQVVLLFSVVGYFLSFSIAQNHLYTIFVFVYKYNYVVWWVDPPHFSYGDGWFFLKIPRTLSKGCFLFPCRGILNQPHRTLFGWVECWSARKMTRTEYDSILCYIQYILHNHPALSAVYSVCCNLLKEHRFRCTDHRIACQHCQHC